MIAAMYNPLPPVHSVDASRAPLRRGLTDQVVQELGSDIIACRLLPGALLPTEAERLPCFGVSRTVLRKAILVLAAKGLVELRHTIEPAPARLAALRGSLVDFTRMRAAYQALEPAGTDVQAFMPNHTVSLPLHKAILDAVLQRVADAALAAMTRHLDDTKRRRDLFGRRLQEPPKRRKGAARVSGPKRQTT